MIWLIAASFKPLFHVFFLALFFVGWRATDGFWMVMFAIVGVIQIGGLPGVVSRMVDHYRQIRNLNNTLSDFVEDESREEGDDSLHERYQRPS